MNYKKVLDRISHYQDHPLYSIPFKHPALNRVLNGVERGKYTVVSGRANSGKTSFVDFYYVISLFASYLDLDPSQRKPLHILYFELKDSEEKKIMKWFASYMMLKDKQLLDINTLRNSTGKSLSYSAEKEAALHKNQDFFEELSKHMTLLPAPTNATGVYLKIKNYMQTVGSFQDGIFQYDKEHEEQITLVIVNNTARLRTELDSYQNKLDKSAIADKLNDYMVELVDQYRISPVIIHSVQDTGLVGKGIPEIRQLDIFGPSVDQGLIMYNPFNYANKNYLNYDIPSFVINNKNRFTSVTVMKNTTGIDHASIGLIFLGEAGYFRECPHFSQEEELATILGTLQTIN